MKKISYILSSAIILLALVSCNMDSSEGLFQEAGKSQRQESYTIERVIAATKNSSSQHLFLISTDEGLYVYNAETNTRYNHTLTGENAKFVVWGYFTGEDNWSAVYYNEGDGKYYTIDQDGGTGNEYADLTGDYIPTQSVYDNNTKKTAAVFKNSEGTEYYVFLQDDSTKPVNSNVVSCGDYTDVSFIGGDKFIGKKSSKGYLFSFDGSTVKDIGEDSKNYFTYVNGCYISLDKYVYKDGTKLSVQLTTLPDTESRAATYTTSGGSSYFVINGDDGIYVTDGTSVTKKTCSGLANIEICYIASVSDDGNYINVITCQSGAKCINLKNSSIDSWKQSI